MRSTIKNETQWMSTSLRACVDVALKHCGYDKMKRPLGFCHPAKGSRRKRMQRVWKWSNNVDGSQRYWMEVPKSMSAGMFIAELVWHVKEANYDPPGKYIGPKHLAEQADVSLDVKPKPKRTTADLVEKREAIAQAHVKRIKSELVEDAKEIKRKEKRLKKWQKKVAYYEKRTSKSVQERDFIKRVKAKTKAIDNGTGEAQGE